jgi:UDP-glucose 4-epimerase
MRCLILGGGGFIGRALVHELAKREMTIRIFGRPHAVSRLPASLVDKVEIAIGDFQNDFALRTALKDVDVVFHLITTTFPSMTIESSYFDIVSNLLPTVRLVELCKEAGIRKIIYASSGGTIYGEALSDSITEDHPLQPSSAYGHSKLMIESYLAFHARKNNLNVQILRLSNAYGPGQDPYGIQGLVAVAMGCILHNRPLKIFGQGSTIRDYIYIDDIIRAFLLSLNREESVIVNISSGVGRSVMEVAGDIERVLQKSIRKEFVPDREDDVRRNVLDNSLAAQLYGWKPSTPWEEGLKHNWDWIKASST